MANENNEYKLIFERRHPKIAAKSYIYKLIQDSYAGSQQYKAGGYLRRGFLEYKEEYEKRLDDSTYENFVQPANDTLTGLLYAQGVTRVFTGGFEEVAKRIAINKSISEFMENVVSPSSLMISGGVLIDSPDVPDDIQLTKKEQEDNKLYPYAIYYSATSIRDYYKNDELEWILLDDSTEEKDDPLKECKKVDRRTLWTRNEIIKYEHEESDGNYERVKKVVIPNKIGIVPFVFCNWRDINDDCITESPFEDIAELNKSIYNIDSLITENAFQSSFSQLIYQGDNETIKKIIEGQSPGSLSVIPIPPETKIPPAYIQRPLGNVSVLLEIEKSRIERIFSKIGISNNSDKTVNLGWKSRKIEFEKCEAVLRGWASNLEKVENKIFEIYNMWDKTQGTYLIEYPKSFQSDTILEKMEALKEILLLPIDQIKRRAVEAELMKMSGVEFAESDEGQGELDVKKMAQNTGNTPPAQE